MTKRLEKIRRVGEYRSVGVRPANGDYKESYEVRVEVDGIQEVYSTDVNPEKFLDKGKFYSFEVDVIATKTGQLFLPLVGFDPIKDYPEIKNG